MHEVFIRKAIELAVSAGKNGNGAFGAVLVHRERILETAENTEITGIGFGHAEFNLVLKSAGQLQESILQESVLYTSCTPCLRCTCAIVAAGIRQIVYSVSQQAFAQLIPAEYHPLTCEEIVRRLELRDVQVIGPVLEEEGLRAFEYWGGKFISLEQRLEMAKRGRDNNFSALHR
ncbi:MAG: nucleoside deaminase [Anaerolineae bacterium]